MHLRLPVSCALICLFVSVLPVASGCADLKALRTEERLSRGLVLILPGSAGNGAKAVARGLNDGGVRYALVEDDWTTGIPLLWLLHMHGTSFQRRAAKRIAERITKYQSEYPGRPVYLIGHSSGACVAVRTLEVLPRPSTVRDVILLGAAVSCTYDLSRALRRVDGRLWNFYSRGDWIILGAGTTLTGNADGRHGASAGAGGFEHPRNGTFEKRMLYAGRLREVEYTSDMASSGHLGGHYGWTNRHFVRDYLAPILRGAFPPMSSR